MYISEVFVLRLYGFLVAMGVEFVFCWRFWDTGSRVMG